MIGSNPLANPRHPSRFGTRVPGLDRIGRKSGCAQHRLGQVDAVHLEHAQ